MTWKKAKLNLVTERQAEGRTRELFGEIKQTLGVPYVSTFFQALARFPQFFDLFWHSAKTLLGTQELFRFSERLGAEAYTRVHNYFAAPALQNGRTSVHQTELQQVIELYQHSSPILLLVCAALVQEFENP